MSSNNQVIILKKKDLFEVHHHFCVDNDFESSEETIEGKFHTLVEAIRFAKIRCNTYPYVEYGFTILDNALEVKRNGNKKR